MTQVKIFGTKRNILINRDKLSTIIHGCMMSVINLPIDKKFHRFFPIEPDNFFFPEDRTHQYTIVEVYMFEGRSKDKKADLIKLLIRRITDELDIPLNDVEVVLIESKPENWGIRGVTGEELILEYPID